MPGFDAVPHPKGPLTATSSPGRSSSETDFRLWVRAPRSTVGLLARGRGLGTARPGDLVATESSPGPCATLRSCPTRFTVSPRSAASPFTA
jgi:hypothetical protein